MSSLSLLAWATATAATSTAAAALLPLQRRGTANGAGAISAHAACWAVASSLLTGREGGLIRSDSAAAVSVAATVVACAAAALAAVRAAFSAAAFAFPSSFCILCGHAAMDL